MRKCEEKLKSVHSVRKAQECEGKLKSVQSIGPRD